MKPYDKVEGGSGSIIFEDGTPTEFYSVTSRHKILNCSSLIHGDFIHPNQHIYSRSDVLSYYGFVERIWDNQPPGIKAGRSVSGTIGQTPAGWTHIDYDEVYNKALTDLLENIRGNLDLSIDLVEVGQTRKMIRAANKLSTYLKIWKPIDIASKYLEFQFGWKPLASSLYGAIDEIFRHREKTGYTFSGRSYSSEDSEVIRSLFMRVAWVDCLEFRRRSRFVNISVKLAPASSVHSLSSWTSLNPVTILWETLPYSFIVDWFYDLGGYLRNFETSSLNESRFLGGYISTGSRILTTCRGVSSPGINLPYRVLFSVNASARYQEFRRDVLLAFPFPHLPKFRVNLNSTKIAELAALALQRVR